MGINFRRRLKIRKIQYRHKSVLLNYLLISGYTALAKINQQFIKNSAVSFYPSWGNCLKNHSLNSS